MLEHEPHDRFERRPVRRQLVTARPTNDLSLGRVEALDEFLTVLASQRVALAPHVERGASDGFDESRLQLRRAGLSPCDEYGRMNGRQLGAASKRSDSSGEDPPLAEAQDRRRGVAFERRADQRARFFPTRIFEAIITRVPPIEVWWRQRRFAPVIHAFDHRRGARVRRVQADQAHVGFERSREWLECRAHGLAVHGNAVKDQEGVHHRVQATAGFTPLATGVLLGF